MVNIGNVTIAIKHRNTIYIALHIRKTALRASGRLSLGRALLGRLVEGLLEDVLGLLERFDLLRARGFAVLVGRVAVHARVLQVLSRWTDLFIVGKSFF